MINPAALPWLVRILFQLWRIRVGRADLYIGGVKNPYLLRWHLLPKDKYPINLYLHRMVRDDDARALHDHPWWFMSIILAGGYVEVMPRELGLWLGATNPIIASILRADSNIGVSNRYQRALADVVNAEHAPGSVLFRRATHPHRLMLRRPAHLGGDSWSLVITGRPSRDWGFYCPSGWRDAREYARTTDRESIIGRGCN
jgi:hypothetical protein